MYVCVRVCPCVSVFMLVHAFVLCACCMCASLFVSACVVMYAQLLHLIVIEYVVACHGLLLYLFVCISLSLRVVCSHLM